MDHNALNLAFVRSLTECTVKIANASNPFRFCLEPNALLVSPDINTLIAQDDSLSSLIKHHGLATVEVDDMGEGYLKVVCIESDIAP